MNERIRQLWDQAAKLEPDPSWEGQTRFMEKFAELIVRECIHVAYNKMAIQKLDGIRPSVVCDTIKEHFGVEE